MSKDRGALQDHYGAGLLPALLKVHPSRVNRHLFELALRGVSVADLAGPQIISIDRSKAFDPAALLGAGWTIWKGPADGDGLSGANDEDERSCALTEADLSKILFADALKGKEMFITGEERVKRLKKAGHVRLDAGIFQFLWENRNRIPKSWEEKINGNIRYIFFDGTILRDPLGNRYALHLYCGASQWGRVYDWLGNNRGASSPSVVLA
ncbi:MAG: hypothetical protein Q7S09_03325 [bacterium]|nr:hypothetical protein [bacterium]